MGVNTLPVPAGKALQEQQFTSSGIWTAPAGVTTAQVLIVSGGGGGSGNPGYGGGICVGGYGGAQYTAQFTVSPSTGYTVTVGAGGAAGGGSGAAGNSSAFSTKTVAGGLGGDFSNVGSNATQSSFSGQSSYGIGGTAGANAAAANSGGGGGGYFVSNTAVTGGAGGSGIVIVRWLG